MAYSFLLSFPDCSFGNGRIGHFTELLNDILMLKTEGQPELCIIW